MRDLARWLAPSDGLLRRYWRSLRNEWLPAVRARGIPRERAEAETVAVCVGVLNRGGARLERLLRTLRAQDLPRHCVDITICDLGSDPAPLEDVRERCARHGARLVALHQKQPVWSRSRALNVAMRCSAPAARYIFPTDVDMLFAPDFMNVLLRTHLGMDDRAFVISDALDLPLGSLTEETDPVAEFDRLVALCQYRNCLGSGACQSATRAWFERVHGYDERIEGWGYEDDDLRRRARLDGLVPVTIQNRTHMLHQWHEPVRDVMAREGRLAEFEQRYRDNLTLSETDPRVVRNEHGWGELPEGAEIVEPD